VFVAVSILQLYEEGLVDLDDDVNTHMPFSIRYARARRIINLE
jgi:CubicO group peptidase (beta-lactamase class C family)